MTAVHHICHLRFHLHLRRDVVIQVLSLLLLWTVCHANDLQVRVDQGILEGVLKGQTVRFLGIQYATAKRFQFPNTNLPPWGRVYNATVHGPSCVQSCPKPLTGLYCPRQMQEDCLTLNIYRPAGAVSQGLPVVVYIHGGDFSRGSGSVPTYDADYFSSRGRVIVVTLNYRLGSFGFLSIFDKYGEAMGNFGLRDQQAALLWIQRNIAAFGGDSTQVTLMGDGSGCLSTITHLASINSQPLFGAAILQSCPFNIPFRNQREAKLQSVAFAKSLNCGVNNVTCYRSRSIEDILHAQTSVGADVYTDNNLVSFYVWGPSIDNSEVFYSPMEIFQDISRFSNKPIIIGTVADEGISLVYQKFHLPLTLGEFNGFMYNVNSTYLKARPVTPSNDMRDDLAQFITDYVFACPSQLVARQIELKQSIDRQDNIVGVSENSVWVYEFFRPTRTPMSSKQQQAQHHQVTPVSSIWGKLSLSDKMCASKSCHGLDTQTIFNSDSLPYLERIVNDPLSRRMAQYWANFATKQSVNGAILSRSHLRSLQMRFAFFSDPTMFMTRPRPRSQRFRFRYLRPSRENTALFVPATTSSLHSALKSFTFWPNFSTQGVERESVMIFQSPNLVVKSNHFESRCMGFTATNNNLIGL